MKSPKWWTKMSTKMTFPWTIHLGKSSDPGGTGVSKSDITYVTCWFQITKVMSQRLTPHQYYTPSSIWLWQKPFFSWFQIDKNGTNQLNACAVSVFNFLTYNWAGEGICNKWAYLGNSKSKLSSMVFVVFFCDDVLDCYIILI